uniref:Novel immune-type receptor 9 n=1 Tax=Scleropages formosus TaxID=113540 RepID=A0A8C9V5S7_SCLFO
LRGLALDRHTLGISFPSGLTFAMLSQSDVVKTFQLGDNVTLMCTISVGAGSYFYWFKQLVGHPPQCILSLYVHSSDPVFYGEFEKDRRFILQKNQTSMGLTILNAKATDAGHYYCLHFCSLIVTGTETTNRYFTENLVLDAVNPGDSVTLQCTVDSETCAGEHSVYWFRHGSGESLPGLIYTHGKRSDECEKSPEAGSPTHGCVYSLPKRNLSRSDAGIYYCAVATCGNILFGNGTKLEIEGIPLIVVLVASNILCVVIIVIFCLKRTRTKGLC